MKWDDSWMFSQYALLRSLYSLLLNLCIPVILLRLWWRGRLNAEYRQRWLERFGLGKIKVAPGGFWIHTVSVGEFLAAVPLIRALKKQYPERAITITTTTPTGSAQVKKVFGTEVFHRYFPYDIPWCLQRFLRRVDPCALVIVETELWPNCLWCCAQQQVPVFIVSGRLSLHSMKGYQRIGFVTQKMLEHVQMVAAQSVEDGERFKQIGLDPKHLVISGNIKFDLSLPEKFSDQAKALQTSWGHQRFVLIGASTHEQEEEKLLSVFREIKKHITDPLLILVPRHPERFQAVAQLIRDQSYSFSIRSQNEQPTPQTEVYLGDTMGELPLMYAASTVAFVGGSLVPIGGHNPLEPAAMGLPVVVGPHTFNFVDITSLLLQANALVQVTQSSELIDCLLSWYQDPKLRRQVGLAGKTVVEGNRGAVEKIMKLLKF